MNIIKILVASIGLLCIFLGLLTPLNFILFIGIGIALVLISVVIPIFFGSEREKTN